MKKIGVSTRMFNITPLGNLFKEVCILVKERHEHFIQYSENYL